MKYREIFPSLRQSCLHRSRTTPGIGAPPCRPRTLSPVCLFPTDATRSPKGGTQYLSLRHVPRSRPAPGGRSAAFSENSYPGTIASERFPTYYQMHNHGKTPAGSGSRRRLLLPRCRARPVRENCGRSAHPSDTQAAFSFGRDSAEMADNIGLVAARYAGDAKRRRFEAASENASQ